MATFRKRRNRWQAPVRQKGRTVSKTFGQRTDALRWANETGTETDRYGLNDNRRVLEGLRVCDLLIRFRDTHLRAEDMARKLIYIGRYFSCVPFVPK